MIAQDYITRALARSYRNRGEVLAPAATEMLEQLSLLFVEYYGLAAGLNPSIFARQAVLAWNGAGWTIPADSDTMSVIRTNQGQDVTVVAIDNLDAEPSRPCIYRLGKAYFPAGQPNDPVNTPLTVFYTVIPADFADLNAAPGVEWAAQFDQAIIVELALWLSGKDGRADEIAELTTIRDRWKGQFTEWCSRESLMLVRQFARQATSPNVTAAKVAGT